METRGVHRLTRGVHRLKPNHNIPNIWFGSVREPISLKNWFFAKISFSSDQNRLGTGLDPVCNKIGFNPNFFHHHLNSSINSKHQHNSLLQFNQKSTKSESKTPNLPNPLFNNFNFITSITAYLCFVISLTPFLYDFNFTILHSLP